MDANLAYPIVITPTINATLMPSPPNPIKDWLPAFISIVVVILGSIATYYVNNRIENNKRQFELKQKVYFDGIDVAMEQVALWSRAHIFIDASKVRIDQLHGDPLQIFTTIKNKLPISYRKEFESLDEKIRHNASLILIQNVKMDSIGSANAKKCFNEISGSKELAKSSSFADYINSLDEFQEKITLFSQAVKYDLIDQPKWWHFLKQWMDKK
jgi:hypothetical protein